MSSATDRLSAALADRYRILEHLGEGGMATVYLAEDLKHDRKVAVKVLRPELAAVLGADRFVQEIKTTASLQHPQILPLFDSGEADGFLYYVMPYVEGETLRDKLNREVQLGVDEAVRIATEVAEALDHAHTQGVFHRDIKPENILLRAGRPMIADFGIALAVSAAAGGRMTETGVSLGTPHYMSPEQATADKELTNRTDIYSLGCVLYEMLVGEPPHTGGSAQAVILRIVSDPVRPVTESRRNVPGHVVAATAKALERLPADRFATAAEFGAALGNPSFTHGMTPLGGPVSAPSAAAWKISTFAMTAVAAVMTVVALWPAAESAPRLLTRTPVAMSEAHTSRGIVDISADGMVLVYEGPGGVAAPLLARRRDALESVPISGTEGGRGPAISPDGNEVAYIDGSSIRIIPITGGTFRPVLTDSGLCCLRWDAEGSYIYFTDATGTLARVASAGGDAEPIVPVDPGGSNLNAWLVSLPRGPGAVYQTMGGPGLDFRIMALDLASGAVRELTEGRFPRYADGFLVYATPRGDVLMAAPFDPKALVATGPARPVAAEVAYGATRGLGRRSSIPYALSADGIVVYAAGREAPVRTPAWVSRDGSFALIDSTWQGTLYNASLSPDGSRLASSYALGGGIGIKQLDDGPLTLITQAGAFTAYRPSWTPGGDSVIFTSIFADSTLDFDTFIVPADGSGRPTSIGVHHPHAIISSDGAWIVYRAGQTASQPGLFAIRRGGDAEPVPLATTDYTELQPALSRDGRFLAYTSNESGELQVYVRPFPEAGAWRRQISRDGGHSPVWAHNGRELFYLTPSDELVAATVNTTGGFSVQSREVLFSAAGFGTDDLLSTHYDVSRDDQRFVMLRILNPGGVSGSRQLVVVDNLAALMREGR